MAYFLDRLGVHIASDFGGFVKQASDRVKAHAEAIAHKAGRPFLYQDRVVHGKDEIARQIATRDGITEGLICVLSTVEVATCFALAGGAIRPRLRKCLHLYLSTSSTANSG
jgi:phosphopentomutase